MATWDDVRRLALALPDTSEGIAWGTTVWRVRKKLFVWDRPLRKSDLAALGDDAPEGPILGIAVDGLHAKEALLADDPEVFFTTPHFDGVPSVLARLERLDPGELEELVQEAWLARAPARLAQAFLAERRS